MLECSFGLVTRDLAHSVRGQRRSRLHIGFRDGSEFSSTATIGRAQ